MSTEKTSCLITTEDIKEELIMQYLSRVFLNNNWFIKLITIVLLTIVLCGLVYVVSALSLFLSTVLNLPGLIVLALLASVSIILISVVTKEKEGK